MILNIVASGSKGNAYLLEQDGHFLLLDAGIPFKTIKAGLGFDLARLDGALVTHEHVDHAQAVKDIVRAGIPIYMSQRTAEALACSQPHCAANLDATGNVCMKDWIVRPFEVEHDAVEPLGFLVFHNRIKEKLVYLTDTGYTRFVPVQPDYLIVECSYCEDILEQNRVFLAERYLRMKQYHFGLDRVKTFLQAIDRTRLKSIVLVHLSATNSDAARMIKEIQEVTGRIQAVFVAQPGMSINLSEARLIHE